MGTLAFNIIIGNLDGVQITSSLAVLWRNSLGMLLDVADWPLFIGGTPARSLL